MPNIRSSAEIAKKWARVTPERAQDYELGVKSPRRDWETATKEAEPLYAAGVQAAIADKRFGKGVTEAGSEKWSKGAVEKGVARFGPGVQVAEGAFSEGFSPFRDTIEAVKLPARYPKGDPRNIDRVKAIAIALHAKKIGK